MDEREKSMTQYFTAIYADLTTEEMHAITTSDKCRFMSHSHVADERDARRRDKELLAAELAELRGAYATIQSAKANNDRHLDAYIKKVAELKCDLHGEYERGWNDALKAQSEPIGKYAGKDGEYGYEIVTLYDDIPTGAELYTAPQPNPDAQDAARYRWLREERKSDGWFVCNGHWLGYEDPVMLFDTELDAAIDAAMKGK